MATKIVQPKVKTASGFDDLVVRQAQNATNANVTNLNTESNAVVNFQIGNGTAYNKTINNVQNAQNAIVNSNGSYSGFVQDDNSVLKTNNQVIGKIVDFNITKKDISSDYTFTDLNFKFGDIIEIIYTASGAGNPSDTANVIYIPLLQYPSGSGYTSSTGQTYQLISRGNGNVFEFSIYVSVPDQSITMKKPTKVVGSVEIGCTPTILKISKIIR